jgi:hypothetical protein
MDCHRRSRRGLLIGSATTLQRGDATDAPVRVAVMCFLTGETTSGFNKICFYACLGSQAANTIGALQFCPLSINR